MMDEPVQQIRLRRSLPAQPVVGCVPERQRPHEAAQQQARDLRLGAQIGVPLLGALRQCGA